VPTFKSEVVDNRNFMPYIPANRNWYLAELVLQFEIEGSINSLVHINTKLIKADSPDEALERAKKLGTKAERDYENTDPKQVRVRFRGLRDLFLICDELEDGAELLYEEREGMDEPNILALVKDREGLAVFKE
jgi:hypothetical protein